MQSLPGTSRVLIYWVKGICDSSLQGMDGREGTSGSEAGELELRRQLPQANLGGSKTTGAEGSSSSVGYFLPQWVIY